MLDIIEKNKPLIRKIATRLCKQNQDYTYDDISRMTITSLYESYSKEKKINFIDIYTKTLNRILEEKGFKYINEKPINILSNEPIVENQNKKYYDLINKHSIKSLIDMAFKNTKLTQEEIFIISLSFNLDTPDALKGEYKNKLDNIEPIYYMRKLTKKEIAKIAGMTPSQVARIQKKALMKMEQHCVIEPAKKFKRLLLKNAKAIRKEKNRNVKAGTIHWSKKD